MVNDSDIDTNAMMKKIVIDRCPHLALFATKDIAVGDQLLYDYGDDSNSLPWRKKVPFLSYNIF